MKVREARPASFWPLAIFSALFVLFMGDDDIAGFDRYSAGRLGHDVDAFRFICFV